jgi:hypothetical protein
VLICLLCLFEQLISWRLGPMVLEPLPASLETGSRSSSRLRVSLAPPLSFIKLSGASVCLFLVSVCCIGWRWLIWLKLRVIRSTSTKVDVQGMAGGHERACYRAETQSYLWYVFWNLFPYSRVYWFCLSVIGPLTVFLFVFSSLFFPLYEYSVVAMILTNLFFFFFFFLPGITSEGYSGKGFVQSK